MGGAHELVNHLHLIQLPSCLHQQGDIPQRGKGVTGHHDHFWTCFWHHCCWGGRHLPQLCQFCDLCGGALTWRVNQHNICVCQLIRAYRRGIQIAHNRLCAAAKSGCPGGGHQRVNRGFICLISVQACPAAQKRKRKCPHPAIQVNDVWPGPVGDICCGQNGCDQRGFSLCAGLQKGPWRRQ